MHEPAGTVEVPLDQLIPGLLIEHPQILQHIRLVHRLIRLLHLHNGFEFAKAVKAQLLCKPYYRRAGHTAGAG